MSQQHCKTFSQENTAFFLFTKHDPFFWPCIWQACCVALRFGSVCRLLKQGPDYRIAPIWNNPRIHQNAAALRLSQLHQLSESPARTCGYLGGVASVQRVFGHEGLQGGEGQVSQVLLVLQRQAQLAQEQPRQEVLPAELPGQVVLGHRGCARTQRGVFLFFFPLLNIWKRTRAPVNCISVCSPSGASIHPKTGYSEQIMEDNSFQ